MPPADAPAKFFARLERSCGTGDFSLVLDLFHPQVVLEYGVEKPLKYQNPENATDALKTLLPRGSIFAVSEAAVVDAEATVNVDIYPPGVAAPIGTVVTFTFAERDRIKKLSFQRRA